MDGPLLCLPGALFWRILPKHQTRTSLDTILSQASDKSFQVQWDSVQLLQGKDTQDIQMLHLHVACHICHKSAKPRRQLSFVYLKVTVCFIHLASFYFIFTWPCLMFGQLINCKSGRSTLKVDQQQPLPSTPKSQKTSKKAALGPTRFKVLSTCRRNNGRGDHQISYSRGQRITVLRHYTPKDSKGGCILRTNKNCANFADQKGTKQLCSIHLMIYDI